MNTELADSNSKKRKRSHKAKDGPSSRRKRQWEDAIESDAGDDAVLDEGDAVQDEPSSHGVQPATTPQKAAHQNETSSATQDTTLVDVQGSRSSQNSSKSANAAARLRKKERGRAGRRGEIVELSKENVPAEKPVNRTVTSPTGSTWHLSSTTGGRLNRHDALFSADEKYLFSATAGTLQVMSVEESLIEATIAPKDDLTITGFALSRGNPSLIYTASKSGTVECWNWVIRKRVAKPTTGLGQIATICVHTDIETEEDSIFVLANADGMSHVLENGRRIYSSTLALSHLELHGDDFLTTAPGKLIVGKRNSDGRHQIAEYNISADITCLAGRLQTGQAASKKSKKEFQPSLMVAVGSTSGEIFLYEDVLGQSRGVVTELSNPRTLHWHREAVEALKWSQDGNYLISGGRETVIVLWQLATGKKQFLPHLSAEIEQITVSPKGSNYAVQLADNSVMVLSTTELRPTAHFAGIQAQCLIDKILATQEVDWLTDASKRNSSGKSVAPSIGFQIAGALHPIQKDNILLTVPPSMLRSQDSREASRPFLQIYDIAAGRHVSRQALTRNQITDLNRGPEGNKIEEPDAHLLQISHDGQWLATIEEWTPPTDDIEFLASGRDSNDEQRNLRKEVYLKIWHWDDQKKLWALQTRIENPHPGSDDNTPSHVLDLASDPAEIGFSTIGADGSVRIWTPRSVISRGRQGSAEVAEWRCKHTVQLEQGLDVEDAPGFVDGITASHASIAYSADGSLLAVSRITDIVTEPSIVHFIHSDTGRLLQSRSGLFAGDLLKLRFLGRHLIILSTTSLTMWDVVSEKQTHRVDLGHPDPSLPIASRPRLLAVNEEDDTIVVALPSRTKSSNRPTTSIRIFRPDNSSEVFSESIPHIITGIFAARDRGSYVLLTSDSAIIQLQASGSVGALKAVNAKPALKAIAPPTIQNAADQEMMDVDDALNLSGKSTIDYEVDNERPVVRPEQLASVFDGPGAAGMPVRAMFEAVVGLFGRRAAGVPVSA